MSFCAAETEEPSFLKMFRLLKSWSRPPFVPEPTPRKANVTAKTTASSTYTGFALRRILMKKSCWFGLPPEACRLRPFCLGAAAACCLAFACCVALAPARAMSDRRVGVGRRTQGARSASFCDPREPDRALEEQEEGDHLEDGREGVDARQGHRHDRDDEVAHA